MKKRIILLGTIIMILSFCFSAEANESYDVHLIFRRDEIPDVTLSFSEGTSLPVIFTDAQATRNVYGWTFTGWYMDPECTELYDKSASLEGETTFYAGWKEWSNDDKEMYDTWLAEMDINKELINYPTMFTWDSFFPFLQRTFASWGNINYATEKDIERMISLRESLVQAAEKDDVVWEIWGENIPVEDTSGYDFYCLQDSASFRPVLVAKMQEDQETVKGNIIICSGGGFTMRSNTAEAYPTMNHMFDLGYNVFVLQYRVLPYEQIDAFLDLQRAVRYLKYHAEDKGIGKMDDLAVIGFSAGGVTIVGQLKYCYGNITPDAFYPDYLCDEIDMIKADYKVAAPVYGFLGDSWDDFNNPDIPAVFCAIGTRDSLYPEYMEAYEVLQELTDNSEIHIYEDVPHGFGMGDAEPNASEIDVQFDAFLQKYFNSDPDSDSDSLCIIWTDNVMKEARDATADLHLIGEEEWELTFSIEIPGFSALTEYTIDGFWYEENGIIEAECTGDGGLSLWIDEIWEQAEAPLETALRSLNKE